MGKYTLESDDWMEIDDSFEDQEEDHHTAQEPSRSKFFPSSALSRVLTTTSTADEHENSSHSDDDRLQLQTRQEETPGAPVHYHIYYPSRYDDDDDNPRRSSTSVFSSCAYLSICLIAVVAHICYWYGPSVPPPEDSEVLGGEGIGTSASSWKDFAYQEALAAWTLLARWYGVGQYVWFWCWEAISEQYRIRTDSTSFTECHPPTIWDSETFHNQLFGQGIAIDKVTRILNRDWDASHPLIFYTIGGPSVGKKYLAHVIASQFVGLGCTADDDHSQLGNLLTIANIPTSQQQTSSDEDGNETVSSRIYEQIFDHATRYPNGSVVLWQIADSEFSDEQKDDYVMPVLNKLHSASPIGILDQTVLILTSNHGNPTLNKALRKYGVDDLPLLELESFLLYEVIQAHNQGKPPSHTNPFSKVHIVPMLPWDRSSMRQLVEHRLQTTLADYLPGDRRKIDLDPEAIEYVLDHCMESQSWIHKKTNQELFQFYPHGAKSLDPLMGRITTSFDCAPAEKNPLATAATTCLTTSARLRLLDFGKFELVTCGLAATGVDDDTCTTHCRFQL